MNSDEVVRLFVAGVISDSVRERLAVVLEELRGSGVRMSVVRKENVHLTFVFLGNIFGSFVEPLVELLDGVAATYAPVSCEVAGLGTFGSARAPRVVWAGLRSETDALPGLHADLSAGARRLGIPVEDRAFVPHLTLGRVKPGARCGGLNELVAARRSMVFGDMLMKRVVLMRSLMRSDGVVYEELHAARLCGAGT